MRYLNAVIIRIYNFVISLRIVNWDVWFFRKVRVWLHSHICWECCACFGKNNPDKTFYVIRCPKNDLGFFGFYNFVIFHMKIAEELGAISMIDLKYYPNDYIMEDRDIGRKNCWEFYFNQVENIGIDDVYRSKNVIMGSGSYIPSLSEVHDTKELMRSHILIEKYIKPTNLIQELYRKRRADLGMEGKRILGVKCRGTDFLQTKPSKHSIVPDAEHTILVIREKEIEWGKYDFIFVATEDKCLYQSLKMEFGERMISNDEKVIGDVGGKWLNELFRDKMKGTKRDRMTEYLISILLLASCDALIAPVVGGTLGAMRIKGQYEHIYLFDLGTYE